MPRSWRSWPVMPNEHAALQGDHRAALGGAQLRESRLPLRLQRHEGVRRLEASRRAGPGLARAGGAQRRRAGQAGGSPRRGALQPRRPGGYPRPCRAQAGRGRRRGGVCGVRRPFRGQAALCLRDVSREVRAAGQGPGEGREDARQLASRRGGAGGLGRQEAQPVRRRRGGDAGVAVRGHAALQRQDLRAREPGDGHAVVA